MFAIRLHAFAIRLQFMCNSFAIRFQFVRNSFPIGFQAQVAHHGEKLVAQLVAFVTDSSRPSSIALERVEAMVLQQVVLVAFDGSGAPPSFNAS